MPGGVVQVSKSKWWNCLGVPTSFVQCARKVMSLKELEVELFYWVDLFRSGGVRYGFVCCRRVCQSCSEPEVGSRTRVLLQGYGVQESAKVG